MGRRSSGSASTIRREDEGRWGKTPFRIGLWVGQRTTPNTTEQSAEALRQAHGAGGAGHFLRGVGSPAQLTNCPWVAFDALASLGAEVAAHSRVFVWPTDKRPTDSAGHYGSLHAKCAIADRDWLLISSANLTEFAFTLNMELGLLIRGGPLPGRVEDYFSALIESRMLHSIAR